MGLALVHFQKYWLLSARLWYLKLNSTYLQKPHEILMVSLFLIFFQAIWMEIKQDPKVHVQEKKNIGTLISKG